MAVQRSIVIEADVWNKLKKDAIEKGKNAREHAGDILMSHLGPSMLNVKAKNVKAIIVAAGMGTRLGSLTIDKPKCMLKVGNKTILERQIEVLKKCGVNDIIVVRGWQKEKINLQGIKYYHNKDFKNNNILMSIMTAMPEMDTDFIVSYSDILFDETVVNRLLGCEHDIGVIIDKNYVKHYEGRDQHPLEEAEKAAVQDGKVVTIAKYMNPNQAHGEFIGIAKFSKRGAQILKKNYQRLLKEHNGTDKHFQTAISLKKAYLTDMLQELIDKGHVVKNVDIANNIDGRWIEIDTPQDLEWAKQRFG